MLRVNGFLVFLLLLIAASLFVLAAAGVRGAAERAESRREAEMKLLLFGLTVGFLAYFLFGTVLVLFPLAIAFFALLSSDRRPAVRDTGTFLIAAAGLWVVLLSERLWNDLADPAVTEPGWSPIPLAFSVGLLILGATLRFMRVESA